jgi:tetratricopeptide (TPR) repeat protein
MDGAPEFDRAIAAGERQLATDPDDVQTLRLMAQAYHGKATSAHATDNVPEHERAVARAIEIRERVLALAPGNWQDQIDITKEHSQHALALMQKGEAEPALAKLRHVRSLLEDVFSRAPSNQVVIRELAESRSRAGWVLLVLGRIPESVAEIEAAIDLLEPLVASDASNRQYIAELATAWVRLGDVRRVEGRLHKALELHRRALQVRRERAKRDSSFMFVPWGLAMSLNAVGELLLAISPANWLEAHQLFSEARDLIDPLLSRAPSFNQLRRELAISYEGLARSELAGRGPQSAETRRALEKSAATWREVFARSVEDRRQADRLAGVETLLVSLPVSTP